MDPEVARFIKALDKRTALENELKNKQDEPAYFRDVFEDMRDIRGDEIKMLEQHIAVLQKFIDGNLPLDSKGSLAEQEAGLLKAEEGLREKRMRVHKTIEEIDLVNVLISDKKES